MFEDLRYHRKLRKLQRERDRALVEPLAKVTEAEKAKDVDTRGRSLADYYFIQEEFDDTIASLVTRHLREQAERLMLPLPQWDDEEQWRESRWDRGRLLTSKGITELRAHIREHERYEREKFAFWVTSLVGVLGAIIGVVGILIAYAALK